MTYIFIRELKKSEKSNPSVTRNMARIPDKPGYTKGYMPYGKDGRGYYYISNGQLDPPPRFDDVYYKGLANMNSREVQGQ